MVSTDQQSKGMFFNTSGVPITTAFTLFDALGDKLPLIGLPWNQEIIVLPESL
jgi:hypothetical protein